MHANSRAHRASRQSEHAQFPGSLPRPESTDTRSLTPAPSPDDAPAVTALWCPHCKTPFIGAVDTKDASFVHQKCGGRSVLDLDLLDALASDSWFWQRYRDRLRGEGRGGD